jgi:DNA (cytosine-5)-methyltransferase 1
MKHLDLFSGIGGFALAAQWSNIETVAFCEIDSYSKNVLKKNFPDVPIFGDIRNLNREDINGTIDIITGGFPCQPFSIAGKKKGTNDNRDLWPEMFRVIQEFKPTWVIGENVANFTNMAFKRTKIDLESEGYEVQPLIIPACSVGAPHKRDRVWILANSKSIRQPRGNMSSCTGNLPEDKQIRNKSRSEAIEYIRQWESEPTVGRVANGISNRLDRNKALGNAIVPQIAYQIMKGIKEIGY